MEVNLLVVAIVECAVSDAHKSLDVMSVRVLSVALQKGQGCHPVSLLDERSGIGHFVLDLLLGQSLLD